MRVQQLWRYPVKSMGGEQIGACEVGPGGLHGDRRWGVADLESGKILTGRREPRLLFATARMVAPAEVEVVLPSGDVARDDRALSAWLGRPVALRRAGEAGGVYENPLDYEHESDWVEWQGPGVAWHDSDRARVSLVSLATAGEWDVRRFRANVVLDGAGEEELVGTTVELGSAVLDVVERIARCVMVTRAQPGLERDLDVLREIHRERGSCLAVAALVREGGTIVVGDTVTVRAPAG